MAKISSISTIYMPTLYAGPNGAGKTTAAKTLLPENFNCNIFINADEIAAQLNPENVQAAAFTAGRIMLQEIEKRLDRKNTFAIEITLATRSYLQLVKRAQLNEYEVVLIFFHLPSVEMAKQRVAQRVLKGGHNIPDEVVERRYLLGIKNLFGFIAIVDDWFVYQMDTTSPLLIAEGEFAKKRLFINLINGNN